VTPLVAEVPLADEADTVASQPDVADAAVAVLEALGEADVEVAEAELDEELPELGVVPGADAKVEKLPVKKPAARRRPTPAKKPAPSGEPEAEAEED
jgi:hypothetical protein